MAGAWQHVGRLLALGGGLLTSAAPAQPQANTKALLQRFIADPNYQAAVWNSARKQAAAMPEHCADVKSAGGGFRIEVAAPVAFEKRNDRYFPSNGAWVARLDADICGTRRQLNILTIVKAGGAVDIMPLLPGTTRSDPVLQWDSTASALRYATLMTRRAGRSGDCKSPMVVDTRFVATDAKPQPKVMPGRSPYAWHEIWTIDYCGTSVEEAIDFTPDPTGTGFNVHAPKK